MRYLALDFGRRRTGVALSDETGKWAFPHATWEGMSRQHIINETLQLVRQHNVEKIVLGLPLATEENGDTPTMHQPVLRLSELLREALRDAQISIDIHLQDERYSTAIVLGQLREAGISQRAARDAGGKNSTDARAAAVILQNFLDAPQPFSD